MTRKGGFQISFFLIVSLLFVVNSDSVYGFTSGTQILVKIDIGGDELWDFKFTSNDPTSFCDIHTTEEDGFGPDEQADERGYYGSIIDSSPGHMLNDVVGIIDGWCATIDDPGDNACDIFFIPWPRTLSDEQCDANDCVLSVSDTIYQPYRDILCGYDDIWYLCDTDGEKLFPSEDKKFICSSGKWTEVDICDDGLDNDGDGYIDCADPDCNGQTGPGGGLCECPGGVAPCGEQTCDDGYDNDGDGFIDGLDLSCGNEGIGDLGCFDGLDNDEDGYFDRDDGGCCSFCIDAGYTFYREGLSIGGSCTGTVDFPWAALETQTQYCCGDDANENYWYSEIDDSGCLGNDCPSILTDTGDNSCCPHPTDCVYNNQCFADREYIAEIGAICISSCGDSTVDQGEECDDGNRDNGDGCDEYCVYEGQTIFMTQNAYSGNLGGLAGADQICNIEASDFELRGYYRAWLSNSSLSVANRFLDTTGPFYRTDLIKVADDWNDLTDGSLDASISDNTFNVWTGTNAIGTSNPDNCNNWNGGTNPTLAGQSDKDDTDWTQAASVACDSGNFRLYCVRQR